VLVLPAKSPISNSIANALGGPEDWDFLIPPIWIMTDPRAKSRPRFRVRDLSKLSDSQRSGYSANQLAKGFEVNSYNTSGGAEGVVRSAVLRLREGKLPHAGAIRMDVLFAIRRPRWAAKRTDRLYLSFRPPDFDNLLKLVVDALNTTKAHGPGLWLDDRQIVGVNTAKTYAEQGDDAHIEMAIYALKADLEQS
jgi:Holliday junction resolvase RusA-like endonuclease